MKNNRFIFLFVALLSMGAILTNCNSPAQRVENAQDDVQAANQELADANKAYLADVENYRKEISMKTMANDSSIMVLKQNIPNKNEADRAEYEKQIEALEQKNTDLKKSMNNYKADGKDEWDAFKTDLDNSMDHLGVAIRDFVNGRKN